MNFFITVWFIVGLSYRFSTNYWSNCWHPKAHRNEKHRCNAIEESDFLHFDRAQLVMNESKLKEVYINKIYFIHLILMDHEKKNTFYHKFKISLNTNDLFIKKTRFPRTCESPHWTGILNNSRGTSKFFIHCETHRG